MDDLKIEIIQAESAAEIRGELAQIEASKARAAVLFVENFAENSDEKFYEELERFPLPVVLGLKAKACEKFVDACHLCVAAESAEIGEFSAAEALQKGLINKIAPIEKVEAESLALAEKISRMAPLAVRAALRAVTEGLKVPLKEGLKLETELFARIFSTADMREGTRAFLEKRRPHFQGK